MPLRSERGTPLVSSAVLSSETKLSVEFIAASSVTLGFELEELSAGLTNEFIVMNTPEIIVTAKVVKTIYLTFKIPPFNKYYSPLLTSSFQILI